MLRVCRKLVEVRSASLAAVLLASVLLIAVWQPSDAESIPLKEQSGTYVIPVVINEKITLDFTIDSGASDVVIPADVFSTLVRAGTISRQDLLNAQVYELADGTQLTAQRFNVRFLRIGRLQLQDVVASVAPQSGNLLLGQSFLSRIQSWSIDNNRHLLLLNEPTTPAVPSVGPTGVGPPPEANRENRGRILTVTGDLDTREGASMILAAVLQVKSTYGSTGVSGFLGMVPDCYEGVHAVDMLLACLAMDAAAEYLIPSIETQAHFPKTRFFEESTYSDRARVNMAKYTPMNAAQQNSLIAGLAVAVKDDFLGLFADDLFSRGDYEKAMKIWGPLAGIGNSIGEMGLARMYFSGLGVEQDYGEAARWYGAAARRGILPAQIALASQIEDGRGVLLNYSRAMKWLDIAMSQILRDDKMGLGETVRRARDSLERKMTADQIAQAQSDARRCLRSNYRQCE